MRAEDGIRWESDGSGEFTIEPAERAGRGTDVTLHLQVEGEDELPRAVAAEAILRKYSDHIALPIRMRKEEWDKDKGEHVARDEEETVNQASALWARPKTEITDEQYREFYKHVAHDFGEPLAWTHNRVEGKTEYTQLLYLPAQGAVRPVGPRAAGTASSCTCGASSSWTTPSSCCRRTCASCAASSTRPTCR